MALTIDEVLEALQIVKRLKDTAVNIQTGDMKLSIVKGEVGSTGAAFSFSAPVCQTAPEFQAAPAPAAAPTAAPAAAKEEAPAPAPAGPAAAAAQEPMDMEGLHKITASVTSVFYRRPSPDEPPVVEEGDEVTEDTPLCLLEVMKCFRQVLAGVAGRIEKICVESNHFVEKGDVLFLIRPK